LQDTEVQVLITSTLRAGHSIIIDNGEVEEGDHKDLNLKFTQTKLMWVNVLVVIVSFDDHLCSRL